MARPTKLTPEIQRKSVIILRWDSHTLLRLKLRESRIKRLING